jgi:hypothetical protein
MSSPEYWHSAAWGIRSISEGRPHYRTSVLTVLQGCIKLLMLPLWEAGREMLK